MSIADKLSLLYNTKQEIRQAIESLGYTVGDIPFSQYPNVIDSMVVTEGGDLFQHGQALNYDFVRQRYGVWRPGHFTLVAGASTSGTGYISEEFAVSMGVPELATGSISGQPVPGFNLLGIEFADAGAVTQLTAFFQGDVEESLADIRVWVGGVEIDGPPLTIVYDANYGATIVVYTNPAMDPWVDGGQYTIGITLDGSEPSTTIDYTTNINDLDIVTRASTATYWGPDGSLLEAAVDEARIQHDPVTGEALGLLVEPQSTNRITTSNEVEWLTYNPFSTTARMDSVGHALGVPISVLECVAPGTVRAATSSNYSNGLVPATISVLAKAEGGGRIILAFSRASLNTGIYFDPATEEFELIGGDRITDYGFERLRDGFYRIWATRRPGPSAGAAGWVHYTIGLTDADVGDRLLVTLLGSADDPAPSSPIPTSGSPVTRAADNAEIDLSDVFNPDEGTLRITAQVPEGEVVASLGDMQVVSDSDELKAYDLNYIHHSGSTVAQLREGIFSKVEYFPEMQEESDLGDLIRTLYGNGEQGAMYIPVPKVLGQQVLYQDAAGTVPVVSDGDPVGLMLDLSGNDNHASQSSSSRRPIYRTDGVLHWLQFDGADDWLGIYNLSLFRNISSATLDMSFRAFPGGNYSNVFGATTPAAALGRFALFTRNAGGQIAGGGRRLDSDSVKYISARNAAGEKIVASFHASYETAMGYVKVNKEVYQDSFQTPGMTSDTDSNHIRIGGYHSYPTEMEFYGLVLTGNHGVEEVTGLRTEYLAKLAGVTL